MLTQPVLRKQSRSSGAGGKRVGPRQCRHIDCTWTTWHAASGTALLIAQGGAQLVPSPTMHHWGTCQDAVECVQAVTCAGKRETRPPAPHVMLHHGEVDTYQHDGRSPAAHVPAEPLFLVDLLDGLSTPQIRAHGCPSNGRRNEGGQLRTRRVRDVRWKNARSFIRHGWAKKTDETTSTAVINESRIMINASDQ